MALPARQGLTVERIGPRRARELLRGRRFVDHIAGNDRVAVYAAKMARGTWRPGLPPLIMTANGTLVNGRHRLLAVLRSNRSVPFYFWTLPQSIANRLPLFMRDPSRAEILQRHGLAVVRRERAERRLGLPLRPYRGEMTADDLGPVLASLTMDDLAGLWPVGTFPQGSTRWLATMAVVGSALQRQWSFLDMKLPDSYLHIR